MVAAMRLLLLVLLSTFCLRVTLRAETAPIATNWDRISVAPMKTSIYIGSVTLTLGVFERQGSTLAATYAARVFPWFFWGETGRITIALSDTDLARLARGEKAGFAGEAFNHRNKTRKITGLAQPVDTASGKFKVRVMADGIELIFNSTYHLGGGAK
jgi:hypothetical protein